MTEDASGTIAGLAEPQFRPSKLCEKCSEMFSGSISTGRAISKSRRWYPSYRHSKSEADIDQGGSWGCALCKQLRRALSTTKHGRDGDLVFQLYEKFEEHCFDPVQYEIQARSHAIFLVLVPWNGLKPRLEPPTLIRAEELHRQARLRSLLHHWLETCSKSHSHCSRSGSSIDRLPTRLLEIETLSENSACPGLIKVVQGSDLHIDTSYVALSHRWGYHHPITLTQANRTELSRGVEVSRMPPKFRDAVEICRWIEVRHIWIDSLCIIQDSHEDWLNEAHQMRSVYSRALLTIAAGGLGDANAGLFPSDIAVQPEVPLIETSWHATKTGQYGIIDQSIGSEMLVSPLLRRSWVIQEQLLSPRTLFFGRSVVFGASLVFFECESFSASDLFPGGLPSCIIPSHFKFRAQDKKPEVVWKDVISQYSWSEITNPSDRIIALAGIAEEMQDHFKDKYIAGLWESDLAFWLCWDSFHRATPLLKRSNPCKAPTWSWLPAPITVRVFAMDPLQHRRRLTRIIKTEIDLAEKSSPTGDMNSARLFLEGGMFPASLRQQRKGQERLMQQDFYLCVDQIGESGWDQNSAFHFRIDILRSSVRSATVYMIPTILSYRWVARNHENVAVVSCLVIIASEVHEEGYERIGLARIHKRIWPEVWKPWLKEKESNTAATQPPADKFDNQILLV